MNKQISTSQQEVFDALLAKIQQSRQQAFAQVNNTLIDLYWHVGKIISHKVKNEAWGKGVVKELARYIAHQAPEVKGFSDKNLWRMKQFYETYCDDKKLSPLVRQLPWTHNTIIFSRCKTSAERACYLHSPIKTNSPSASWNARSTAHSLSAAQIKQCSHTGGESITPCNRSGV